MEGVVYLMARSKGHKLRIIGGPYNGREKTLGEASISIGRDAEAGLQILDRSASRFHAEVLPVGHMFFVRDLLSKNGTYLNGELLEDEELLREGDVIRIGTTELAFESGAALHEASNSNLAYDDNPNLLSNTLEFRIDELADLVDQEDDQANADARTLQILYQMGRIIGSTPDGKIPAQMLDYLINAMPADTAIIFMRNRSTGKLSPHTVRTSSTQREPVIARSIIRHVVLQSRAVITDNAQADERFNRQDSVVLHGICAVICVPLSIGGQIRGVLYLSRGPGEDAFTQRDLEMVSACAMQLGLAFASSEQRSRQRRLLWNTLGAMVKVMESSHDLLGSGERCARSAGALARALGLGESSIERVQIAALLHRIDTFMAGQDDEALEAGLALLAPIDGFVEIIPLIENTAHYLRGEGEVSTPVHDLDVAERILHVAVSFERAMLDDPEADAQAIIDRLAENPRLDRDVVDKLKECHLSGNLYASIY